MTMMEMRPTHERVLQRPSNIGKVFYVHNGGNAGSEGTDPNFPLSTITLALAQCRANKNDYVFVLDHWTEAGPILVEKEHVHIIGTGPDHGVRTILQAATDVSIFSIDSTAAYSEIAGFSLGGGATGSGILMQNSAGVWIHHNMFGHSFCGDTPLYGISSTGANSPANCLIEDNIFYGDGKSDGTISSNGFYVASGAGPTGSNNTIIRRNMFLGLVGASLAGAILLDGALGVQILNNMFHVTDAADGDAINLIDVCQHCVIMDNRAAHGTGVGAGNNINPYRDLNTNTLNGWAWNSYNNAFVEPVGV